MLFGGETGHRVEERARSGSRPSTCPVLHHRGHSVCDCRIELRAFSMVATTDLLHRLRQPQPHLGQGEDVGAEDLAWRFAWIEAERGRLVRLDIDDRLNGGPRFRSTVFPLHPRRPRLLAGV